MSTIYKMLGQAVGTTSPVAIASPGSGVENVVKNLFICNTTASPVDFSIFVVASGSTYDATTALFFEQSVPAKTTVTLDDKQIGQDTSNASLAIKASAGSALTFTFFGVEFT